MYATIEIDFDVFKAITARRNGPDETENDVLRSILNLGRPLSSKTVEPPGKSWVPKGVEFPHGTKFRARYRGELYYAEVVDGALEYGGEVFNAPSAAAFAVTKGPKNGWRFWEAKLPNTDKWVLIDVLRKKK